MEGSAAVYQPKPAKVTCDAGPCPGIDAQPDRMWPNLGGLLLCDFLSPCVYGLGLHGANRMITTIAFGVTLAIALFVLGGVIVMLGVIADRGGWAR